ncbi:MAG: CZB domain-containing protein [Aquificaceae bacterium]|nr:CZB domain-containing protein [Aquificaceae bacterium]
MRALLLDLLKETDLYISSHSIYISKFEKALQDRTTFEHKTCRECAFGQRFYSTVYPHMEEFEDDVRKALEEIEKIHCDFHQTLSKIDTRNPADGYEEDLRHAKNLSTQLIQKLLQLRRLITSS